MRVECRKCGMQLDPLVHEVCPKCDSLVRQQRGGPLHRVDIAHGHDEGWAGARDRLMRAIDRALLAGARGLKVIHGLGAAPGHSDVIRQNSLRLLKEIAAKEGYRLVRDRNTDGAHLLYF